MDGLLIIGGFSLISGIIFCLLQMWNDNNKDDPFE